MAEGDAKRWFKYGCLGCLGCLGLIVIVFGLTLGTAWFRAKSEKVEDRVLTHPVPTVPAEPQPPQASPSETATGPRLGAKARGTLIVDFHDAEFHIRPGAAGDPIRVEATYDKSSFALEQRSEEGPDGTWTYRVELRRTKPSSFMTHILQHLFSDIRPSVRILVPPDAPLALEATLQRGGMEVELGGTHVTSAKFNVSMGGVQVRVSEPLAEPMERFELRSHMGGGELRSLGNASPRVLDVDCRMGGADLDLSGAWRADADITLHGTMGGMSVRLPEGVRVEGVAGREATGPQDGELKVPTLRFTSSSEMGEVEFR